MSGVEGWCKVIGIVKDVNWIDASSVLTCGRAGVVVIFDISGAERLALEGERMVFEKSDGWLYSGEALGFGVGIAGFFVEGLAREDAAVGWRVGWGAQLWAEARGVEVVKAMA